MEREARISGLLDGFSSTPLDVLPDKDKRDICDSILDRQLESDEEAWADRKDMIWNLVGCILISLLTLIPILLPTFLMDDFMLSLRVASALSSVVLFFVGFFMAPHLGSNRWITGFTMLGMSLIISIVATFTGG